jgi:3-oxoacyl-[acyl-carrier protein] reductase
VTTAEPPRPPRPLALVTGASRSIGIGASIAVALAADGWDVATTHWTRYDARMTWGSDPAELDRLDADLRAHGARTLAVEADLEQVGTPAELFDAVENGLGPVAALVVNHCESVDSDLLTTTVESFDRHFAVNARATWLLVREFALRYRSGPGRGRIVAITSDHTASNLPYGASKGAMDRIVLAAADELAHLRVRANVVDPGPTDTGWMTEEITAMAERRTPLGRVGRPRDAAALVAFLCSEHGGWINGQLLHSNGGFHG